MGKKIKSIFRIIIWVCVLGAVFLGIRNFLPYERCYFKIVGATKNSALGRDVINCLGEPEKIITDKNGSGKLYYDGLVITCGSRSPLTHVQYINITSQKYRFGLYNIGVGSPKKMVDLAYRMSNAYASLDGPNIYIDNHMLVEFKYDKNDKVSEIFLVEYWSS